MSANLSTQSAPLAPSNFLHDLDRTTQEIVSNVFQKQKITSPGDSFTVPYCGKDDNRVCSAMFSLLNVEALKNKGGV